MISLDIRREAKKNMGTQRFEGENFPPKKISPPLVNKKVATAPAGNRKIKIDNLENLYSPANWPNVRPEAPLVNQKVATAPGNRKIKFHKFGTSPQPLKMAKRPPVGTAK
jgi:hypothetical protein